MSEHDRPEQPDESVTLGDDDLDQVAGGGIPDGASNTLMVGESARRPKTSMTSITDGTSNTLAVGERQSSTQPTGRGRG